VRRVLRQAVLAAAEADLQPQRGGRPAEGGVRFGGERFGKAQPGQREIQQKLLARTQRMAAQPPIQTGGRRLDREGPRAQR